MTLKYQISYHMILCEQALGDGGKEELSFNRKRAPVEPAPLTEQSIVCLTVASFCRCSCFIFFHFFLYFYKVTLYLLVVTLYPV